MGLGADAGKNAVDELTNQTVPELAADLHSILDRLNGSTVTVQLFGQTITAKLSIPEKTA